MTFDEWVARQDSQLSDAELRELWLKLGRYPHLDGFDEGRIDRIAASHGDGEHYEEIGNGR